MEQASEPKRRGRPRILNPELLRKRTITTAFNQHEEVLIVRYAAKRGVKMAVAVRELALKAAVTSESSVPGEDGYLCHEKRQHAEAQ